MSQELLDRIIHATNLNNDSLRHPERRNDEVCLGNVNEEDYKSIGWITKRKGILAYNINGDLIPRLFPVFVKKQEIIIQNSG